MKYEALNLMLTRCNRIMSAFDEWNKTHDKIVLAKALREAMLLREEAASANMKTLDGFNVSKIIAILANGLSGVTKYLNAYRVPDTEEASEHINVMAASLSPLRDAVKIRTAKIVELGFDDIEIPETQSANEDAAKVVSKFKSVDELRDHVFSTETQQKRKEAITKKLETELDSENILTAVSIERMAVFTQGAAKEISEQIQQKGLGTKISYVVVDGPVIIKTKTPIEPRYLERAGLKYAYLNNATSQHTWRKENVSTDKMREHKIRVAKPITSNFIILFDQKLIAVPKTQRVNLISTQNGIFRSQLPGPKKSKGYVDLTIEEVLATLKAKTGVTYIDLVKQIPETLKNTPLMKMHKDYRLDEHGGKVKDDKGHYVVDEKFPEKRKVDRSQKGIKNHRPISAKNVDAAFVWVIDKNIYNKLGPIQLENVSIPF